MKRDIVEKFKKKSSEELKKELETTKDALWQLRTDLTRGKAKNARQVRQLKKTIALVYTILRSQK